MLGRVLIAVDVEDDQRLRALLLHSDLVIESLSADRGLWKNLMRRSVDLLIIERALLPGRETEAIASLASIPDAPAVLILRSTEDGEDSARLVAAGATAVLSSTITDEALRDTTLALLDRRQKEVVHELSARQDRVRPRLSDFQRASPRMQRFLEFVERVVRTDATLLVTGETGVGKEHLANAIHSESHRSSGPFVPINCAAFPENLLESELFGHEEGAFTGASRARRGWLEIAHGGTLFLDEIGDLSKHLQVKLLRFLQSREIQRVGGSETIDIDVRIMAATNRNLEKEIAEERFRTDLYYRLSVVTLEVPPLRERHEDIPALVQHFITHFRTRMATPVHRVSPSAMEILCQYSWPGNVRELINVIERTMLLTENSEIQPLNLPRSVAGDHAWVVPGSASKSSPDANQFPEEWLERSYRDVRRGVMKEFERDYLGRLLTATRGQVGAASEIAGMNRRSFYEKMRTHGLRKESFRPSNRITSIPKTEIEV